MLFYYNFSVLSYKKCIGAIHWLIFYTEYDL